MKPFSSYLLAGLCLLAFANHGFAAPPAWWSNGNSPVIDLNASPNNLGPANIGQAKCLDPDSNLKRQDQFKNVIGFDAGGNQVWIADLPTPEPTDVYYKAIAGNPLKLYSFCSFGECLVDPETGKILSKPYYK